MLIVADENIPLIEEFFADFGGVSGCGRSPRLSERRRNDHGEA